MPEISPAPHSVFAVATSECRPFTQAFSGMWGLHDAMRPRRRPTQVALAIKPMPFAGWFHLGVGVCRLGMRSRAVEVQLSHLGAGFRGCSPPNATYRRKLSTIVDPNLVIHR